MNDQLFLLGKLHVQQKTSFFPQVCLLSLWMVVLTRAAPHPLLNFILSGDGGKEEKRIEEWFGGPPCTVPEVIDQKVECVKSLETHCNNVYEDYCITEQIGEECQKEVRKDCKKTYTTECITEWLRECEQEEYIENISVCEEKLSQECKSSASGLDCKDVPSTNCNEQPVKKQREKCQQNPKQSCRSTPKEECQETPKTVCRPVAQLDCTKILQREDCREIPSLTCKPNVLVSVDVPCTGKKGQKKN